MNRDKTVSMSDPKQEELLSAIKEHPSMASLDSSSSALKHTRFSGSINDLSNSANAASNYNSMSTALNMKSL